MAHKKFPVEVLTPEGEVFNDEVEMVSTKTRSARSASSPTTQPVLAMLDPTELRLYKTESEVVRFAQAEGYMQVAGNHALILVEEATRPVTSTPATLRERLQQAERELESAGDDSGEAAGRRAGQAPAASVPQHCRGWLEQPAGAAASPRLSSVFDD